MNLLKENVERQVTYLTSYEFGDVELIKAVKLSFSSLLWGLIGCLQADEDKQA